MTCSTLRIRRGHERGGGQRIIGLEFHHGPHDEAERFQRVLQRLELREQERIDTLSRLVARPASIAPRFDDVIGGDAHVGGPTFEGADHRLDDAAHCPKVSPTTAVRGARRVEVTEQLVRPVDQVHDHKRTIERPDAHV